MILLLTVIGIPGAGKSTLCRYISNIFSEFTVIHIEYDNFLPDNLLSTEELKSNHWKCCRQAILCGLELFLSTFLNSNISFELSTQLKRSMTMFPNITSKTFELLKSKVQHTNGKYILLLDDNYFYRSMRCEVFKLAKKNSLSFGILFCKCDITVAKDRVCTRNTISIDTLDRMLRLFELPQNAQWEKYVYTVDSTIGFDKSLKGFKSFLEHCFRNPFDFVCDFENLKISQDISREENERNISHKLDLMLRKIVNDLMADSKYKKCGQLISGIKKSIHSECKEDALVVSSLMYGNEEEALTNEIKLLFYSKLTEVVLV